ncbi:Tad domain-containing protein [Alkalibacillus haloalkaliphilus]|uniref:Tad domain-containing protein n=1 Tax=Alkalibacillus haloalkaliphilus TaxID=94136 RepID=UPI002936A69A|nr:Tad domain-containing protein [Alkalibacillus haloalkaliphilus]MDV2580753.1 Tad domain-containing protein [Alkalibacillus haloalkaliphilus]
MGKLFNKLKSNVRNEKGGTLILVALSLVVLLGFAALVIDGGLLYAERSKLQKTMDAAVLAAAYEYFEEDSNVVGEFTYVSEQNGLPDDGVALSFNEETSVEGGTRYVSEVSGSDYNVALTVTDSYVLGEVVRNKGLTLANVLDFSDADVFASSKAKFGLLNTGMGVSPMFIDSTDFEKGDEACLKRVTAGSDADCDEQDQGNFGFLDFDGYNLKDSFGVTDFEVSIGDYIESEPGNQPGHWRDPLGDKIDADTEEHCENYETADLSCERVLLVPTTCIIPEGDDEDLYGEDCIKEEDIAGKTDIPITGFGAFWLESVGSGSDHTIMGRFLEVYSSGDVIEEIICEGIEGCNSETSVNVVRLVNPASD